MNYRLKSSIDECRRRLAEKDLEKVLYLLGVIETEAAEVSKNAEQEMFLAKAIHKTKDDDFRFIKETLDGKRVQFVWSFAINAILVITIVAIHLASRLK